jgi:hypothetical protein
MAEGKTKESLALETGTIRQNAFSIISFSALGTAFPGLKRSLLKFLGQGQKQLDIKGIKGILLFCIMLLLFYFINNVVSSLKTINNLDFYLPKKVEQEKRIQETLRFKELTFYTEKIQQRDIFRMGPKPSADAVAEVVSSKAAEATKNLKLVGISWSENPDAIIEDGKGMRTFFVKKGQMIGDVQVESILKEKVILRYGEEMIELR